MYLGLQGDCFEFSGTKLIHNEAKKTLSRHVECYATTKLSGPTSASQHRRVFICKYTFQEVEQNMLHPDLDWTGKVLIHLQIYIYDSMPDLGEIRVYQRADFQSGSRVLKKVF